MPEVSNESVTVCVASLNTAEVTELCIRSLRKFAGAPMNLQIGDCGSTDGSLEMLRGFETEGWLSLEVAEGGRQHGEWLDQWLTSCTTRFLVFSDSDVEYQAPNWLKDMLGQASNTGAALVCGRMQYPPATFVHPKTGARRRLAQRPTPWLLMLDLDQLRGAVSESFGYKDEQDPEAFGGKVAYDVGAKYFAAVVNSGLHWAEMPPEWQSHYRHFGGLTWLGARGDGVSIKKRAKQILKLLTVKRHLKVARKNHWGAPEASS